MLTLERLVEACNGNPDRSVALGVIHGATVDSRRVKPGDLFVCLRGERVDGHHFVQAACDAGAAAILAETGVALAGEPPVPVIRVADPIRALGQIAQAWRRALGTRVVGVTGSSGKTSTKEMLATYLMQFYRVARTEGNQNNELGVPLSLLAVRPEHDVAIIEMGMRGLGQIAYLTELAEPDLGLITNIGTAHIELLGSRENIARAKTELWHTLKPGGIAVVPLDDDLAHAACQTWGGPSVTWSLSSPAATVWASDVQAEVDGQSFTAHWQAQPELGMSGGHARIHLPLWGDHHRSNALSAIATGWALGQVPPSTMTLQPTGLVGRARWVQLGSIWVQDDTYNANPDSMRKALQAFIARPCDGRRVVCLGDMAELGEFSASAHRDLGAWLASQPIAFVLACGEWAPLYLASGTPGQVMPGWEDAARFLETWLTPGDQLFLKASRAARLERVLDHLESHLRI